VDTKQLAYDLMAAISAGDFAGLEAMCAEDMTAEWLDSFKLTRRADVIALYRHDHDHNADYHAEVVKILLADEQQVCFRGRVGGTQVKMLKTQHREYQPLGKSFVADFLSHVVTREGKVVAVTFAYNPATVLMQLGHLEPF
jgi:ketosteroid isomerase-like protein